MKTVNTIMGEFNLKRFKQLKKDFDKCVSESKTLFISGGLEYDRGFARYLLEYLTPFFKNQ